MSISIRSNRSADSKNRLASRQFQKVIEDFPWPVAETLLVICTDKHIYVYIYCILSATTSADFYDRVRDNDESSWNERLFNFHENVNANFQRVLGEKIKAILRLPFEIPWCVYDRKRSSPRQDPGR